MIRKRFAIRIANRTKCNLSIYFATRFYRQIIERLYDFWCVIVMMMRRMPSVVISKTDTINGMPRFSLREVLAYSNLIHTIQCTNNQVIIITQKHYFIALGFKKMNIVSSSLKAVIVINNIMAKVTLKLIDVITQATIQIIITCAAYQKVITFIAVEPISATNGV